MLPQNYWPTTYPYWPTDYWPDYPMAQGGFLSLWMGTRGQLDGLATDTEPWRAVAAWRRIQDKPSSVAFRTTTGTTLATQTVRLESDNRASPAESTAGNAPRRKLIIFGIRNHPTLADTNMQEGYRFILNDDAYRVMDTILTIGEIQGIAEAVG